MDMTLDANAYEFLNNPREGIRYAEWKKQKVSNARNRHLAETRREEELRNEANSNQE